MFKLSNILLRNKFRSPVMFNTSALFATILGAATFFACQPSAPAPTAASPLTITMAAVKKEKCVRDSVCATLDLSYPVLTGGTATTAAINDSIEAFVYLVAEADANLPLAQALDSAAWHMFAMLKEGQDVGGAEYSLSYTNELKSKVVWQTNRYLSLEMNTYAFAGGAHGIYGTLLETFDLNTGKPLELTDIIRDTTALRLLLEKAFVDAKKADAPAATLKDLLLVDQLTMPAMYCLVPAGVRFVYNPYEVAPYAVGQTDILLTWQQLGALTDPAKWQ